ncbi:hypothetical protein [Spirosoma linguale]|uniref:Uncharacterized protein n=1 Tax=Spirosoma linguale (strain ATCC 33905 / DSM 74 / LMG 10896 / Claus 1) TaxID=504472 RepID=D2QKV8_SPILD|nr:hypothetical protein Slin_4292 [Spirosoma linguale DSM 74]
MKIPKEKLVELIFQEQTLGEWRHLLKEGYSPNDYYFEFGLHPTKLTNKDEFKIVINHHWPIRLGKIKNDDYGWLITNSPLPQEGRKNTLSVDDKTYDTLLEEADMIYQEYKMEDSICFWSIPNKWFANTKLVQLIEKKIPPVGPWSRADWYWP